MPESPQSFVAAEAAGLTWKRRAPRPEDDQLLAHTLNWLNAMPRGARPVHLQEDFPRIANDISRLWSETAALDHYFEDLDFSPRTERTGFAPVVKEELLAVHLFSLRNRTGRYEGLVQTPLLKKPISAMSSSRVV